MGFLDASVLLAACRSANGASRAIVEMSSPVRMWVEEVAREGAKGGRKCVGRGLNAGAVDFETIFVNEMPIHHYNRILFLKRPI